MAELDQRNQRKARRVNVPNGNFRAELEANLDQEKQAANWLESFGDKAPGRFTQCTHTRSKIDFFLRDIETYETGKKIVSRSCS